VIYRLTDIINNNAIIAVEKTKCYIIKLDKRK